MIDWDFFTVNNFSSNVFISLYFDGAKKGINNLEDLKIKNGTLREGDTKYELNTYVERPN